MISPVTQIKERLSIVDVISGYIKLEKAGIHFKARCPFHNEKTPSFFISTDRGSYHCFGCGRGGDIFTFVQEIEGLDFSEALKMLAGRAGVALEKINTEARNEEMGLEHVLEEATKFYEGHLREDQSVIAYLKKRGLSGETAKKFRIGYAPDGWRNLSQYLESKKIPMALAEKAGLVIKSDKPSQYGGENYYDRFRGRIMFPIASANGKVVAFSGRIFPEPTNGVEVAKYINSPETSLYSKSKILFGYDKAKHAIMRANACIVVEGQMDLCMAHQAGTTHTVAVSGTALTEEHLKLVKRFTDTLILSFDADTAGIMASKRSVTTAFNEGMDVFAVTLENGKDPADIIKEDGERWKHAVAHAKPFVEFYLEVLTAKITDARQLKKEVTKEVLPFVDMIASSIDKAHFISLIAERLGVPEDAVRDELKKVKTISKEKADTTEYGAPIYPTPFEATQQRILGGYLWKPIESLKEKYSVITGTTIEEDCAQIPEAVRESLILEAELTHTTAEHWHKDAEELLLSLEEEMLDKKFETILREMKKAESLKDATRALELLKESNLISKRKQELKKSRISH